MLTAGAAVLTAALGPGGTAKALLSAAVAGVEATSAGAGEVGSDSVLAAPSALCGRHCVRLSDGSAIPRSKIPRHPA